MKGKKVLIIGAGLCGSLLALRLAQKGYNVVLREKRPDMRKKGFVGGRSINLALSDRGLRALRMAGIEDEIRKLCIPMEGRMIHFKDGEKRFSRYSGREEDYINSVSRGGLNIALLDRAERTGNVEVHFDYQCLGVDLERGIARFRNTRSSGEIEEKADVIFGTDGAGSAVRQSFMKNTTSLLFNYSQHFLRTGYKELSIPPKQGGGYRIENNALHIWPRGSYMIIALPNLDGSFTVTLFWPFKGDKGFEAITTPEKLIPFFEEDFPDLLPHLPELDREYFDNPTGALGTIKCYPWQAHGKVLLMGDAAHAIVPFYGQGMNASFEDVLVLNEIHDEFDGHWPTILEVYEDRRKKNTDAIADLALDNFIEMQEKVADPVFIKKRDLEMRLEQEYKNYYSKYSLVTFQEELPYFDAMQLGRQQDELLLDLCRHGEVEDMDLEEVYKKVMTLSS
ncbi:MAG: NAD(P)/FAD-dependent oxidoreductase [Saprospiraceae bacterium]|nr:NAD(P)/FAD-dependent oxidoreductase [Saprospiraceae bacterium]